MIENHKVKSGKVFNKDSKKSGSKGSDRMKTKRKSGFFLFDYENENKVINVKLNFTSQDSAQSKLTSRNVSNKMVNETTITYTNSFCFFFTNWTGLT